MSERGRERKEINHSYHDKAILDVYIYRAMFSTANRSLNSTSLSSVPLLNVIVSTQRFSNRRQVTMKAANSTMNRNWLVVCVRGSVGGWVDVVCVAASLSYSTGETSKYM